MTLATRVSALESQFAALTTGNAVLNSEIDTSLLAAEKRAKTLDGLYREVTAENEALYERFNAELGKVLGKVRAGDGVAELKAKLKEALDEANFAGMNLRDD